MEYDLSFSENIKPHPRMLGLKKSPVPCGVN